MGNKVIYRVFYRFLLAMIAFLSSFGLGGAEQGKGFQHKGAEIVVIGNERIDTSTIISYMGFPSTGLFTDDAIDNALKTLYATDLFSDVRVVKNVRGIVVNVRENPILNKVVLEGNKNLKDKFLVDLLLSKPLMTFSKSKVKSDAQTIIELYRQSGYLNANIQPKVIYLESNRINLVFEIKEGSITYVDKIIFLGNNVFSDRKIRKKIQTSMHVWWNIFSRGDVYNPDRLNYDKELLWRFYATEGYIDFRVLSSIVELTKDREGFVITFKISEGERYFVSEQEIVSEYSGVSEKKFAKFLDNGLDGKYYDIEVVDDTTNKMLEHASKSQISFVDIEAVIEKDAVAKMIKVIYKIIEAPRVYLEKINISGNVRTLDKVIRRKFLISEGDPLDIFAVRRARRDIQKLGFFKKVDISTVPGKSPEGIELNTEIEEQSTGSLIFGIGYSSSSGIGGSITLSERNFRGRGQYVHIRANIRSGSSYYDFRFSEPYFLNRPLTGSIDIFHKQTKYSDDDYFNERNLGIAPGLGFEITPDLSAIVQYRLSKDGIYDFPAGISPLMKEDGGNFFTSRFDLRLFYDKRGDILDTTSGYFAMLDGQFAFGGDPKYLKIETRVKGYYPILKDSFVASLDLSGGWIAGYGNYTPKITERFILGGDTLRGFKSGGLGPLDTYTGNSLGGKIFGVARGEIEFPLGLSEEYGFKGALFLDVGTIFGLDKKSYRFGKSLRVVDDKAYLRASTGLSIIWKSPFGRMQLSFSKPLVTHLGDKTEAIRFSVGTDF
jgi:outer membrane protein insertion porin family